LREHRDLVGYLVADFLLGAGALQGGILLIGGFIGLGGLGSIRAAQVLTGPLGILIGAGFAFGLPEVSRRTTLSSARRWQLAIAVSVGLTLAGLLYTGVLLVIPDSIGVALFKSVWAGASGVLLPVSLVSTFAAACTGPVIVILALGQSRATFRLTAVEAVMVLFVLLVGGSIGGVTGAAWGLSIQQAILVPLWFLQLRSILRKLDGGGGEPLQATGAAQSPA
jgi:O-antigen/teichoic acid export membrane protein